MSTKQPTRREAFRQVLKKAKKAESGRWLNKGFEVGLWCLGSALVGLVTGNYAGLWAGLITGASGLLLMAIVRGAWFLFTGWYTIYCELQQRVNQLEAADTSPADPVVIRQIMENLSFHGESLAMKRYDERHELYREWNRIVEEFAKIAFVDLWKCGFLERLDCQTSKPTLLDHGRVIKNDMAVLILQRCEWLASHSPEMNQSTVRSGCTQDNIKPWVNWSPPDNMVKNAILEEQVKATKALTSATNREKQRPLNLYGNVE